MGAFTGTWVLGEAATLTLPSPSRERERTASLAAGAWGCLAGVRGVERKTLTLIFSQSARERWAVDGVGVGCCSWAWVLGLAATLIPAFSLKGEGERAAPGRRFSFGLPGEVGGLLEESIGDRGVLPLGLGGGASSHPHPALSLKGERKNGADGRCVGAPVVVGCGSARACERLRPGSPRTGG